MLSSVYLCGRLSRFLDESTREVELERVTPGPSGEYEIDVIPVRCSLGRSALFFSAKEGSLIVVKGRLERDETLGVIVRLEVEEIYSSKNQLVRLLAE